MESTDLPPLFDDNMDNVLLTSNEDSDIFQSAIQARNLLFFLSFHSIFLGFVIVKKNFPKYYSSALIYYSNFMY